MKRLIALIILLCVAALGLGFAVLNTSVVKLDYYFGTAELPLAFIVVLAVLVGAMFGGFASLGMLLVQKRHNKQLRRRISLTEKEIRNLREIPIKDRH